MKESEFKKAEKLKLRIDKLTSLMNGIGKFTNAPNPLEEEDATPIKLAIQERIKIAEKEFDKL